MFSIEVLIMTGVILFCLGGLLGAIVSRSLIPPERQKELERRLQTSQEELDKYHMDVAEHFVETSRLVGNLSQSYRDLHKHLARSAVELSGPEIGREMLEASEKLGIESDELIENVRFEPPKDWAPKVPGQLGTLSEEFGLKDEAEEPGIEALTAGSTARIHKHPRTG